MPAGRIVHRSDVSAHDMTSCSFLLKVEQECTGLCSPDLLRKMHAYWRAANYLSVGQIYLQDNPLLDEPLTLKHVKTRLLGALGDDARVETCSMSTSTG